MQLSHSTLFTCSILFVLLALARQSQQALAQAPGSAAAVWSLATVPTGARVRLLNASGERLEGRVAAVSDTVLQLHGYGAALPRLVLVRDIRTLEVHATPVSRGRASLVSAGVGAVLGALAGAASHGSSGEGGPAGFGDPPSRAENIAVGTLLGSIAGWAVGRYAFGRARWQPVPLP